ncbi:hypothetical protein ACLOJK_008915 [Asimina triloba]
MSFAYVAALLAALIMFSSTFADARAFEGEVVAEAQVEDRCGSGTWCISDPGANEAAVAKELAYECTVVNCADIQPGRPCFEPNNTYWHASVVFNLYYRFNDCQRDSCVGDFTGVVTTEDPCK